MVEYLNRIDEVMEKGNYAQATMEKIEDVRLGDINKFKDISKRDGNEGESSPSPSHTNNC